MFEFFSDLPKVLNGKFSLVFSSQDWLFPKYFVAHFECLVLNSFLFCCSYRKESSSYSFTWTWFDFFVKTASADSKGF